MERQKNFKIVAIPGLIQALTSGFKIVSEHMELILLPMLFDLLVWLGPRLSIYELLSKNIRSMFARLLLRTPITLYTQIDMLSKSVDQALKDYNLTSSISTFPFSVPVLLNGLNIQAPAESGKFLIPSLQTVSLTSVSSAFLISLAFAVCGFLFGMVYYTAIAHRFLPFPARISFSDFIRRSANVIFFLILAFLIISLLMIPLSCISSITVVLSPVVSQIIFFLLLFALAWLVVPFFFVFHGLFYGYSIRKAVRVSFNIGNWFSSAISFFIIEAIVISQGLKLIWNIPQTNSWLMLISIFGNAYITTSLIGASFILYWNFQKWMIDNEDLITKGTIQK